MPSLLKEAEDKSNKATLKYEKETVEIYFLNSKGILTEDITRYIN